MSSNGSRIIILIFYLVVFGRDHSLVGDNLPLLLLFTINNEQQWCSIIIIICYTNKIKFICTAIRVCDNYHNLLLETLCPNTSFEGFEWWFFLFFNKKELLSLSVNLNFFMWNYKYSIFSSICVYISLLFW